MMLKSSILHYVIKIWGNKIVLFLFLINLITNCTLFFLSSYRSLHHICYVIAISALFATMEGILYHLLKRIHLHHVFLIAMVSLHILFFVIDSFLYLNFNFLLSQDAIDIMAQTTSAEAKSFLSTYVSIPFLLGIILLVVCIIWFSKKVASKLSQLKSVSFGFMALSLIGAIIYIVTITNYVLYHNGESVPQLHSFTRTAYSSTVLFNRHTQIVTLRKINSNIKASKSSNCVSTIIVVIGESFSPYHSSLYGYSKETNPLLSKRKADGSLTVFNDVATFSDHTEMVMCSVFPLNKKTEAYFTDPLFPACFKAAGYSTMMLDNQYFVGHGITFLTDPELSSLMFDYRNKKGYQYDGDMLQEIQYKDSAQLIVLHLQGNHYTYSDRYPKQFALFTSKDYSNLSDEQKSIVAHYDNAVLYNDYVIDQIIKANEDRDCLVVYFSDHGEEVYEIDDYLGHGNAAFRADPTYQVKVPLFIWTSKEFCSKHGDKAKRIKEAADKPIITSYLSHFLIDVADIITEQFNPELSFINDGFKVRERIILNSVNYEDIKKQPRITSRYR